MSYSQIDGTFPHYKIRVEDKSIYTPLYTESLPLHRPIWFLRAQKGPIGVPVFCSSYNYAVDVLGQGTFDKNTIFYSREAVFARHMFERQGGFFVRLADDTNKYASVVLECHMTEAMIPQWERDVYGNLMYDADDNYIPVMDGAAQALLAGYTLSWHVRQLEEDEDVHTLEPKTVSGLLGGSEITTIYPIIAKKALSPGSYGNDIGFKMYFDEHSIETAMVEEIQALTYIYQPVEKTYGQDTVTAIRTAFGESITTVALSGSAIDKRLDRNMAMVSILDNTYFNASSGTSNLPYSTHVYDGYLTDLGNLIVENEKLHNMNVTGPHMFNVFDATDVDGSPMFTAEAKVDIDDPTSVMMNQNFIIYLRGGSDGDISDPAIEELTRQFLLDEVNLDIDDSAKVPITHLYDTGVTIDTKKAMISFLGRRDDVKVVLSTQDCSRDRMNTMDEDMSMGSSLHAACVLQPESQVHGTEVCRAEIYQQAALLADSVIYDKYVPATLDALIKRCRWQSRSFIEGMPKGLPFSSVDRFRSGSWNWTPAKANHKQLSWSKGLNYFQYYDRSRVHYPDLRSVYRYDTSVLSSAIFVDAVVYAKHVIRFNWARTSGLELTFSRLAELAKKNTMADLKPILNRHYKAEVEFYQTDEERKIGFITHGRLKLTAPATNRVWVMDIECYRENFNAEVDNLL